MRSVVSTALAVTGVVVVVVAVLLITSGASNPYHFDMKLADADGLINGSEITEGGVPVGTVHLSLAKNDKVLVQANLDKNAGKIGQNATVDIAAINLLGQKRVELMKGDASTDPAQDGFVLPTSHVTEGTDLDQVLDMLTPTVRDRLEIMLDEAGTAVAGRQMNIAKLITQLPRTISGATSVLQELTTENGTLADLVSSSDQTITAVTNKEADLNTLIGTLGQSAVTVQAKDAQLRETLADAPATLTSADRFLSQLQTTVGPLGPAATAITQAAPELVDTIKQLPTFNSAIQPSLHNALAAAPALDKLATQGTPVIKSTGKTVASLATFSNTVLPLTTALNSSEDNIIAVVANWSRAVEDHDGLSHIFRGGLAITPLTLDNLINRFAGNNGTVNLPQRKKGKTKTTTTTKTTTSSGGTQSSGSGSGTTTNPVTNLGGTVTKTLNGVTGTVGTLANNLGGAVGNLLGGGKSSTKSSNSSTTSTSGMSSLLNYLLKP